jgi:hypothetical protein
VVCDGIPNGTGDLQHIDLGARHDVLREDADIVKFKFPRIDNPLFTAVIILHQRSGGRNTAFQDVQVPGYRRSQDSKRERQKNAGLATPNASFQMIRQAMARSREGMRDRLVIPTINQTILPAGIRILDAFSRALQKSQGFYLVDNVPNAHPLQALPRPGGNIQDNGMAHPCRKVVAWPNADACDISDAIVAIRDSECGNSSAAAYLEVFISRQSVRKHDDQDGTDHGGSIRLRIQMPQKQAPAAQVLPIDAVDNYDLVHKIGVRSEIRDGGDLSRRHIQNLRKKVRGGLGLISPRQIVMHNLKRQVRADGPADGLGQTGRPRAGRSDADYALSACYRLDDLAQES